MNDEAPSRQQEKFVVRLPDGMRERIAKAAELNGRSMNAEIVKRLEDSFPTTEQWLIQSRTEELERVAKLRSEQEKVFLDLLGIGEPRWEVEYREYARLHAIESSLQNEIEGYAALRAEVDAEADEEIRRIWEEEQAKHSRDYELTDKGRLLARARKRST